MCVWGGGGGIGMMLNSDTKSVRDTTSRTNLLNDIGRNSLLGNGKKIAKFLMRTFTYRSTFLYAAGTMLVIIFIIIINKNTD